MSIVARDAIRELQRQQLKRVRNFLRTQYDRDLDVKHLLLALVEVQASMLDELDRLDLEIRGIHNLGG